MPVRRATPEEVDEANRIRGEGWTVFIPSRPRPKTEPRQQPSADGEAKPAPEGSDPGSET